MTGETVLVTGGSGFVGVHSIVQLLQAGYQVRTTVRSASREADVRAMLGVASVEPGASLSFVTADLTSDANWPEAVSGCRYVLHVASPFSLSAPAHENDLIIPAREGTLRVLRAARDAGVKRVVLTSSTVAIVYGHPPTKQPFTEESWTKLTSDLPAYYKSKTLAERAAWDFVASTGGALELAVVNPVGIFGPALGPDYSDTIQIVRRLLDGGLPAVPRMALTTVDVRDVADLHLRAMIHPAANGERFIAANDGHITLQGLAAVLRQRLGKAAARVPTRVLPDWLVRLAARFDASLRLATRELGQVREASNEKARRVLGWSPRTHEETIVATAESLLRMGLLRRA
jgi:nucleoside-diphosphate-sugar epimerase